MGIVSKDIADRTIAGEFASDFPTRIIRYTNAWGEEVYGRLCRHDDPDRYAASDRVRNPSVYWEAPK